MRYDTAYQGITGRDQGREGDGGTWSLLPDYIASCLLRGPVLMFLRPYRIAPPKQYDRGLEPGYKPGILLLVMPLRSSVQS